jgi:ubiquinone/menaquinone biosynthesis C-methylase UbiE
MAPDPKREYFDALSSRWDDFTDHARVRQALGIELDRMQLSPDERIVDLGCGTGNLTAVLLEMIGECGSVTSVDFSESMVAKARSKFADSRVRWCVADAVALPLDQASVDRVICFSAWPHFPDQPAVLKEANRILRTGGIFSILHIDGRDKINQIHSSAAMPIMHDLLPPVSEVELLFPAAGFAVEEIEDSEHRYCITGRKARACQ